ncbi:MAG TPA: cytochrome P450 [Burkholderiales bacterium]|nr:cytochrome P450 [Burkholderiales bacterium]
MSAIHLPALDSTKDLLADPYRFISKNCRQYSQDIFEARILLKPTYCMTGAEAAEIFYDNRCFKREGAAPEAIAASLFGKDGVQQLDDGAHKVRKAMFMSIMAPHRIDGLVQRFLNELEHDALRWSQEGQVRLYDAMQRLLTRAVCDWAGVPVAQHELADRTAQLASLFDSAAVDFKGHLQSRRMRHNAERWISELIKRVRAKRFQSPADSVLYAVASHIDADGRPLDEHTCAVELLNVLRPTVAVSVYLVFVAHALRLHPASRPNIAAGDQEYTQWFVDEIRRFYPFFPAVAARVRQDFRWKGILFPEGRRVILDLYGTNHDPRLWQQPEIFEPLRFKITPITPYNFIPQGGADPNTGHRCPGEVITLALMHAAARFFAERMEYRLPPESLQLDMGRMPPVPRNRFLMQRVSLGYRYAA